MGYKIKIEDNESGRVIADYKDANAVMGVICSGDNVQALSVFRGNGIQLAHCAMCLQKILEQECTNHPELNPMIRLLTTVKEVNDDLTNLGK